MKKVMIALALALILPAQSNAQFFKKLGKALEEVGGAAVEVLSNTQSSNDSKSGNKKSRKTKKKSSTKTEVTSSTTTDNVKRTFTIQATNYSTFAVLKSGDVNIRNAENTKSGKLMMWSSDDGSCETVTKYFFSDQNNGRYRTNSNTGSTVEAVHLPKGFNLPCFGENDGWFTVDVSSFAPEIGGAFIMRKFCDVISVDTLKGTIECPTDCPFGACRNFEKINCRTTGKFTDLLFAVSDEGNEYYSDYGVQIGIYFPMLVSERYFNVKRLGVTLDFSDVSSPRLEWKDDGGMGDEVSEVPHITMKQVAKDQVESAVTNILLNMDEDVFTKFIDKVFTYNTVDNTGFNYFKADDGNIYYAGEAIQSPFFVNKSRTITIGTGKKPFEP